MAEPTWIASNAFWGLSTLGVGIVVTVVVAYLKSLRLLLLPAWLCFLGSSWFYFRSTRPEYAGLLTAGFGIVIAVGIAWMYRRLPTVRNGEPQAIPIEPNVILEVDAVRVAGGPRIFELVPVTVRNLSGVAMGIGIAIPEILDFTSAWIESDDYSPGFEFVRWLPSPEILRFRMEPVPHLAAGESATRIPLAVDSTVMSEAIAYANSKETSAERSLWWIVDREQERSKLEHLQLGLASERFRTHGALTNHVRMMEDRDLDIPLTVTYQSESQTKPFTKTETLHYDHETRRLTIRHCIALATIKRTKGDEDVCEEIKVLSGRIVEWFGRRVEGNEKAIDAAIRQLESDIGAVRGDRAFAQALDDFQHFSWLFFEDSKRLVGLERRDRLGSIRRLYDALARERGRFLSGVI